MVKISRCSFPNTVVQLHRLSGELYEVLFFVPFLSSRPQFEKIFLGKLSTPGDEGGEVEGVPKRITEQTGKEIFYSSPVWFKEGSHEASSQR